MDNIIPIDKDSLNRASTFKVTCPNCGEIIIVHNCGYNSFETTKYLDLDNQDWIKELGDVECSKCHKIIIFN